VAKFCESVGKAMTVCVVRVKAMDARTVLSGKRHGKHQVGRPGRGECL
jgi:hypothetical protein